MPKRRMVQRDVARNSKMRLAGKLDFVTNALSGEDGGLSAATIFFDRMVHCWHTLEPFIASD